MESTVPVKTVSFCSPLSSVSETGSPGAADVGEVAEAGERLQLLDGGERRVHRVHDRACLPCDIAEHVAQRARVEALDAEVAETNVGETTEGTDLRGRGQRWALGQDERVGHLAGGTDVLLGGKRLDDHLVHAERGRDVGRER